LIQRAATAVVAVHAVTIPKFFFFFAVLHTKFDLRHSAVLMYRPAKQPSAALSRNASPCVACRRASRRQPAVPPQRHWRRFSSARRLMQPEPAMRRHVTPRTMSPRLIAIADCRRRRTTRCRAPTARLLPDLRPARHARSRRASATPQRGAADSPRARRTAASTLRAMQRRHVKASVLAAAVRQPHREEHRQEGTSPTFQPLPPTVTACQRSRGRYCRLPDAKQYPCRTVRRQHVTPKRYGAAAGERTPKSARCYAAQSHQRHLIHLRQFFVARRSIKQEISWRVAEAMLRGALTHHVYRLHRSHTQRRYFQ